MLGRRPSTKSVLRQPAVVGSGIAWHGPGVYLIPVRRAGPWRYRLAPPAVVATAVIEIFAGPQTILAPSFRGRTLYGIRPPLIGTGVVFRPITTTLASNNVQPTQAVLRPPTVLAELAVFYGPQVTLAPQPRPQTLSRLLPPAVIDTRTYFGPVVSQTYSQRGVAKYRLAPPAVIAVEALPFGPKIALAPAAGRKTIFHLFPPVIPPLARPTQTRLAYSRRGIAVSTLFAPVVIDTRTYYGPATSLAYSLRGRPKSRLAPPVVITAEVFFGPATALIPSRRGRPVTHLFPPVIPPLARPITVHLAYSLRGEAKSRLLPPAVIDTRIYFGPAIAQTYSLRGRAKSRLAPPVVVTLVAAEIYYGPKVHLAPSRRPLVLSDLAGPRVVFEDQGALGGTMVVLAPQRRGLAKTEELHGQEDMPRALTREFCRSCGGSD